MGGGRPEVATRGHYLRPAVFVDANNSMRISREEIFGPIASVIRAGDYDEALALANDTEFGLVAYVVYRRVVEGTSLTRRVTVPAEALIKEVPEVEYGAILVPIFGTRLDDDIVGTAGRFADVAEPNSPDGTGPHLDVVYVIPIPLTVPLDAPPPRDDVEKAEAALRRAKEVGEEYESVAVSTEILPARSVGAGIVEAARRRGAEAIVMGGEPPTRMRGGAILGGIGAARPPEIGEVTEYVLRKAPCRVLLTAPPEG